MRVVVITGSTRGIGFGLAKEFLRRDCAVVVSGRSQTAVDKAVAELAALTVPSFTQAPLKAQKAAGTTQLYLAENTAHPERVLGQPCDVTSLEQVQALWEAAKTKFGRVDVWINNAGLAHSDIPFWEQPANVMHEVVSVNVLGVMHGSQVAVLGMAAQGSGAIYNFEGFGSNGRTRFGLGVYGSTKAAERFFTRSLAVDVKAKGLPVQIGSISPGIVITDLVIGQYQGREQEFVRARRVFNILGDKVETVTPFIAEKVLAGESNIQWLTGTKVMWRFATASFAKRDLFTDSK